MACCLSPLVADGPLSYFLKPKALSVLRKLL